jgi:ribosomal protein S18 acetylase RimI-like enzyme
MPPTDTLEPLLFHIAPCPDVALCVDLRIEFLTAMTSPLETALETRLREANRRHLQEGFADGSVLMLVARVHGEIAGCVLLQQQTIAPNLPVPSGRTGLVLNLHVREPFRRRGLGEALMRALEAEGRNRGLDRLELKATEMGEPLYRRLGWSDPYGGKPMELPLR